MSWTDQELLEALVGKKAAYEVSFLPGRHGSSLEEMVTGGLTKKVAERLLMAQEYARRAQVYRKEREMGRMQFLSSKATAEYLRLQFAHSGVEEFHALYLTRNNTLIASEKVAQGGISGVVADPRVIVARAAAHRAANLIVSHNHPSGGLKPSRADEELTLKLREGCRYFDIRLMDHLILTESGYYSFVDEGLI